MNVFKHHDGIVHHQANGQHQRQQRQRIDREAGQRDERKGTHQADRNRHQRNDRRAQRAQEHKDHQRHQHHGFNHRPVDSLDRTVDEHRQVVGLHHRHAGRQVALNLRHQCPHAVGHLQRVSGGVADDAGADARYAVQPHPAAFAGGALFHPRHVGQAHGVAGSGLEGNGAELRHRVQVGARGHAELALLAFDAAGRHLQVLPPHGVFHVLHGQPVRGQLVGVHPNPHRVAPVAAQLHVGHAGNGLQARLDNAVDQVGELQRAHRLAGEGQPDGGCCVGFDFGDDGFIHRRGQAAAHARHAVAHFGGRRVGVFAELEAHRDLAAFGARHAGKDVDAIYPGDGVFQRLGDLRLDDLGRCADQTRVDVDQRLVDARVFAQAQLLERHQPDEHQQQRHHARQHRPADGGFRQLHGVSLSRSGLGRCGACT